MKEMRFQKNKVLPSRRAFLCLNFLALLTPTSEPPKPRVTRDPLIPEPVAHPSVDSSLSVSFVRVSQPAPSVLALLLLLLLLFGLLLLSLSASETRSSLTEEAEAKEEEQGDMH